MRRATVEDMDWLVDTFQKADEFYPSQTSLFCWDSVEERLSNMMVSHVLLVAERGGELVGYIGGYLAPHIFNPKLTTLIQALWWVDEDKRGGKIAYKLLKEFERFGASVDFVWLNFHVDTPIKTKSMERLGYKFMEKWYLKERS